MGKYKNQNKGYYWILTAIEVLSRYACAIPVYRKDTNNITKAVTDLLKQFEDYPKLAQFDDGKELYNTGVKSLLEKSDKKAAVVEIFLQIDVLDELVYNYNDTKHNTISIQPSEVNKKNDDEVWNTLYSHNCAELLLPQFKNGDTVRISKYKSIISARSYLK